MNVKWWHNLWMISLGLLLGWWGFKEFHPWSITLGPAVLQPGFDMSLVMLMLFIIPNFYQNLDHDLKQVGAHNIPGMGLLQGARYAVSKLGMLLRASLTGALTGLIPGMGTAISSNVAYSVEQKISASYLQRLTAAESANNAAVITCLLTVLLFGLPILASEALILDLIYSKGTSIGHAWFTDQVAGSWSRLDVLMCAVITCNALLLMISWFYADVLLISLGLLLLMAGKS